MSYKNSYSVLPYETILQATNGDCEAISAVEKHYGRYILSLSKRAFKDENGNIRIRTDEQLKEHLTTALYRAVAKFKI